jgi:hypothetical protein
MRICIFLYILPLQQDTCIHVTVKNLHTSVYTYIKHIMWIGHLFNSINNGDFYMLEDRDRSSAFPPTLNNSSPSAKILPVNTDDNECAIKKVILKFDSSLMISYWTIITTLGLILFYVIMPLLLSLCAYLGHM